jgi:putative transposase
MNQPPRRSRRAWNEAGNARFLTYSCFRRMPLLTLERTRRWVVEALAAARRERDVALWAYVVMPEHVHVLVQARQAAYEMRSPGGAEASGERRRPRVLGRGRGRGVALRRADSRQNPPECAARAARIEGGGAEAYYP